MYCYLSNGFSVIYNYIVNEYYDVKNGVLVANFKQTSVLQPSVSTSLDSKPEIYYTVIVRKNHVALLSSIIGLQHLDAHFNELPWPCENFWKT